jgi:hypothetical protein
MTDLPWKFQLDPLISMIDIVDASLGTRENRKDSIASYELSRLC